MAISPIRPPWLSTNTPLSSQGPEALMARTPVIERIEGSKDRVTGAPPPHRDSSQKKCPAEAGHKCGNGKRIQTAQSFERQGRRPSALGHDGRWRWIFANR